MLNSRFGYKYNSDDFRDNRSWNKAKSDYSKGKKNEEIIMSALVTQTYINGVSLTDINYEKVDKQEALMDNKIHIVPDYYYYVKNKTFTFEIKCNNTGNYVEDEEGKNIWVKCGAIITMVKNPKLYPNGFLLAANERQYAIMPVSKVSKYPLRVIEAFSTKDKQKKGFFIPIKDLEWKTWLTPLSLN